jgi:hypothetical protein
MASSDSTLPYNIARAAAMASTAESKPARKPFLKGVGSHSLMVCKGGDVKVKEGSKPWVVYTPKWYKDNMTTWYGAAYKFCDDKGCLAMLSHLLACVHLPQQMSNKDKRHNICRKAARVAGYQERAPLPKHFEVAVKELYPEANGKYTGYKNK